MSRTVSSQPRRHSLRDARSGANTAPVGAYVFETWEEDLYQAYALGADPSPCPQCGSTGFYGPRFAEPDLRLRSCRFCGFWQEIAEPPERATAVVHGCAAWPQAARAPYLWWVPPSASSLDCPFCEESVSVGKHCVTPPSDDPAHPWWKVPQTRGADYYRRFWANWGVTKGRVFF